MTGSSRQQTITIRDTPSPAVSVITISDSDDEAGGKGFICLKCCYLAVQVRPCSSWITEHRIMSMTDVAVT